MTSELTAKPLASQAADALTARNRAQSPLLRLPGELRNKIYAYALSDGIVTVFGPRGERKYHFHAQLTASSGSPHSATNLLSILGFTTACRQLHAETQPLVFPSITFHIHSDGSFVDFLDDITDAQRGAIANVQLTTPDAREGGRVWAHSTIYPGSDHQSQEMHLDYLEWSAALPLDRLTSLKRVAVEDDEQWIYSSLDENYMRWGVKSLVEGRDVEVVVPEALPRGNSHDLELRLLLTELQRILEVYRIFHRDVDRISLCYCFL